MNKKHITILKKTLRLLFVIVAGLWFLLPIVNMLIYFGFQPETMHTASKMNPLNLTIIDLWLINLFVGALSGLILSTNIYIFLCIFCGLLYGVLLCGSFLLYLHWREHIELYEIIIPLSFSIIITMKVYDFLKNRFTKTV